MASQVIEIEEINSTNIARNTLVEERNMPNNINTDRFNMEIKDGLSAAVLEVLDKDNYVVWSARVKTYLMAQDLWVIIEETTEPPKQADDEAAFKAWSEKNSTALHVLQVSCGPDVLSMIRKISSAKIAWNTLAVILQVLKKDNYVDWSVRVKNYLTAHHLWEIIEATTQPPRQEDDEAAFKDWSKKNYMALHIIQISCGPDSFSEIIGIDSAKAAWDRLAKRFLHVLEKHNYVDWNVQVRTYLMAHHLWEIIEATTQPPKQEDDEAVFKAWSKKNSMALQVIQISCGPDSFSEINGTSSAKVAWDTLGKKFKSGRDNNGHFDRYKGIVQHLQRGHWALVQYFHRENPDAFIEKITAQGKTALHIAVIAGQEDIVEKLVSLMSKEVLEIQDNDGWTALAETAFAGNYRMAKCMLTKNKRLASIGNVDGRLPVDVAIEGGHKGLASYLYFRTPREDLNGISGTTLCTKAIYTRTLDIAWDLLKNDRHLALAPDKEKVSPLYALASTPIPSENQLVFWKRWIYARIRLDDEEDIFRLEDNEEVERRQRSVQAELRQLVSSLLNLVFGIKDLYEMALANSQSDRLIWYTYNWISMSNDEQKKTSWVDTAILHAVKEGNFEFVYKIVRRNPDLLWCKDDKGRTIFPSAVLYRQTKIFSLIYGLHVKLPKVFSQDCFNNNILHMTGMLEPSTQLNRIPGAALQMQRELQWFKEVESIVNPQLKEALNNDRLTPRELFTRNHKDMMKAGEQQMKDTASSCTVVGALIVTIMFAAAFTIPGGNDQDAGLPMFLNKKLFKLFIVSDSLSLFSSATSILMFLAILTSSYEEEDFLKVLPTKMIIGLFTLIFSIAFMMVAFCAALLLMLRGQTWFVNPIIFLASVPVTLFVLMQFPPLIGMIRSTYGSSIFDRKMERLF